MSAQAEEKSNERSSSTGVGTVVKSVRNLTSTLLVVFGAALILIGYLIRDGVWAAIIPVWGAAIALMGFVGYVYVWRTYGGR